MKKILIVNNNMHAGGVQKSLYNLLWSLDGRYEITLLLFAKTGAWIDQLPPDVKIIECKSLFRYLGVSQGACKGAGDKLRRGILAAICRVFGRPTVMKRLLASQKMLPQTYDCAISYLHNGGIKSFYGGVQEFVLNRVNARRKVAFLHCDYRNCGGNFPENNRDMERFDAIAACSDGCRRAFLQVLPALEDRCMTVRNCHRFEEIHALAQQDPVMYDSQYANVVMVSRLAHEKGLERAVKALAVCADQQIPVRLHLVGGGPMEGLLRTLAQELGVQEQVFFYGEQSNPYRYVAGADLLLMTSFHEAAPMVIEEAHTLGVPVLTTRTTSSDDMVTAQQLGWVCPNDQEGINSALVSAVKNVQQLRTVKERLRGHSSNNEAALAQFAALIEG